MSTEQLIAICGFIIAGLIGAMWAMLNKKFDKVDPMVTQIALLANSLTEMKKEQETFLQEFKQYTKDLHELILFKKEMNTQWTKFDAAMARISELEKQISTLEVQFARTFSARN